MLCLHGYFKQTVHESQLEHYRVRYVKVGASAVGAARRGGDVITHVAWRVVELIVSRFRGGMKVAPFIRW